MFDWVRHLFKKPEPEAPKEQALDTERYSPARVDELASRMTDEQGVEWATTSARMAEGNLPDADKPAIDAAETWLAAPSPETQQLAQEAAAAAGHAGPGAWSAQAAAWSQATSLASNAAGAAMPAFAGPAGSLAKDAVAGAVKLAAAAMARALPVVPNLADPKVLASEGAKLAEANAPAVAPAAPAAAVEAEALASRLKPFIDLGEKILGISPV